MSNRADRYRGRIIRWDAARGFGFVKPDGGGPDTFLHISDCKSGDPQDWPPGSYIEFSIGEGRNGRSKATDVVLL